MRQTKQNSEIQLIYLGPIEGMIMYFSDAVVVQVPTNVSHKRRGLGIMILPFNKLNKSPKLIKVKTYTRTYIVTYPSVNPLKAFGGTSSR